MSHEEMIAVIQAHKEGKIIQYKDGSEWVDCTDLLPAWNFASWKFRIKPPQDPTPKMVAKEWLQEMIDNSEASTDAYNALGKVDQYNYYRGQQDVFMLLLDIVYHIKIGDRVFPLDKEKRKDIIDSIFENYKPK